MRWTLPPVSLALDITPKSRHHLFLTNALRGTVFAGALKARRSKTGEFKEELGIHGFPLHYAIDGRHRNALPISSPPHLQSAKFTMELKLNLKCWRLKHWHVRRIAGGRAISQRVLLPRCRQHMQLRSSSAPMPVITLFLRDGFFLFLAIILYSTAEIIIWHSARPTLAQVPVVPATASAASPPRT
ncbi:hypothetical protein FB45DRAFT_858805 [Roridomyces roridus]|uniref:Uncharacterized protein n=1 Tax=Roridomyces roridus TaxID=1738132 RepID=A0AAD7G0P5_9AGAR|nr:hypothetical protein FB45DRAFT_858805 [Roridomyces roridus]